MALTERIKQLIGIRGDQNRILKEKFSVFSDVIFGNHNSEAVKRFRLAFRSLVLPLLMENGSVSDDAKNTYRELLEEFFNIRLTENKLTELTGITPLNTGEAAKIIRESSPDQAEKTVEFLTALTISLGEKQQHIFYIREAAADLGMPGEKFSSLLQKMSDDEKRKIRLRKSGRGILAALIIILIFFLTAKYLQSVIFGILLACILLPLERFFEKQFHSKNSPFYWIAAFFSLLFSPLKKLSDLLSRKGDQNPSPAKKQSSNRKIVRKAVGATLFTAFLIVAAAGFGVSKLTGHYMKDLQHSIRTWEMQRLQLHNGSETMTRSDFALEKLRDNFEAIPLIQKGIDYLQRYIRNPEIKEQLFTNLMEHSGGIIGTTGMIVNSTVSFLCNLLLTLFFAILFLLKFAEYTPVGKKELSGSEYIVRNFYNGIWLPGADENLISETCRIINGIIFRLRSWLKGYLTLILVDSTVYTTCFFFLGIPYFLPLGVLAGCGIALPYLGPVISCGITLLVTLASGIGSPELLLAVIICYLIYNGIIEQFILYPAVIGDSLGLSTLETIVVVLLGAIVAGIPGMIFALPTASVAKYLIPQIYHGFIDRKNQ
ncbi:MAG: AI-2E family transporter [Lentisphaerae bacterium]|nr:AI-2E family transporter [Lentisphaerota bacterium]